MERKVGEVFEYEGKQLQVKKTRCICDGCYFDYGSHCRKTSEVDNCSLSYRKDDTNVIFIELKENK